MKNIYLVLFLSFIPTVLFPQNISVLNAELSSINDAIKKYETNIALINDSILNFIREKQRIEKEIQVAEINSTNFDFFEAKTVSKINLFDATPPYKEINPIVSIKKGSLVKVIGYSDVDFMKYIIEFNNQIGMISYSRLEKTDALEKITFAFIEKNKKEKKYLSLIVEGDKYFSSKYYELANNYYLNARKINDNAEYPVQMLDTIRYITVTSIYNNHIKHGDHFFNWEDYYRSYLEYKNALEVIPNDSIAFSKMNNADSEFKKGLEELTREREKKEYRKKELDKRRAIAKSIKEREKIEKHEKYIYNRFESRIAKRIISKEIWLGMTSEMARLSLGDPNDINRTVTSRGIHEQWVYGYSNRKYLYFENGILKSWQD